MRLVVVARSPDSLAGVVGGVVGTVSGAVAAEESGEVLGRDGGVLAGPPGLGFHPRPLQNVVRVLTGDWREKTAGSGPGLSYCDVIGSPFSSLSTFKAAKLCVCSLRLSLKADVETSV